MQLYRRADLAKRKASKDDETDLGLIGEYPSEAYESHDIAYYNDDVILAYAVVNTKTDTLRLELVSKKWARVEYIELAVQDRTDPAYGKQLEDNFFIQDQVRIFDNAIHCDGVSDELVKN